MLWQPKISLARQKEQLLCSLAVHFFRFRLSRNGSRLEILFSIRSYIVNSLSHCIQHKNAIKHWLIGFHVARTLIYHKLTDAECTSHYSTSASCKPNAHIDHRNSDGIAAATATCCHSNSTSMCDHCTCSVWIALIVFISAFHMPHIPIGTGDVFGWVSCFTLSKWATYLNMICMLAQRERDSESGSVSTQCYANCEHQSVRISTEQSCLN